MFNSFLANIYFRMFANLKFWIAIFGVPFLAVLPDLTLKYFKQVFFPSPSDWVIEIMLREWKLKSNKYKNPHSVNNLS